MAVLVELKKPNGKELCPIACSSVISITYGLAGLVIKASASGAEDPGFESCLQRDFSGSRHTSDIKIGTPVAAAPGVIGSALGLFHSVSVYCD